MLQRRIVLARNAAIRSLWRPGVVTLRRLKWITIVAPVAFFAFLAVVDKLIPRILSHNPWPGYFLTGVIVLVVALFFSEAVFGIIGRLQSGLTQQNRELLALHQAGIDIASELQLDAVLQKIVDQARELVGALYGVLSVPGQTGGVESFLTSGLPWEDRARINPPAANIELMKIVARGQTVRLSGEASLFSSLRFLPNDPPICSLLAVPIPSGGRALGILYLLQKQQDDEFTRDDEETLERFATQAAVAIENARLHRRVREMAVSEERQRIAREMHDSLAQVLGYVNTKAQASQELLRNGQTERASAQIGQLAEAARAAYADVRENILSLRTSLNLERDFMQTLREYLIQWQDQSGISVEVIVEPGVGSVLPISPASELQLIRIIQEALANVRKHSMARHACVRLQVSDGWLKATVEDNGVGFDPSLPDRGSFPRFGLSTMRERAEAVGGRLYITSAPENGTRVTATFPVDVNAVRSGESYAGAHS